MVLAMALFTANWQMALGQGQRTTTGTEFMIAFMENLSNPTLEVFISGEPGTEILIDMPAESGATYSWIGKKTLGNEGYYQFKPLQGQVLNTGSGQSTKGVRIQSLSKDKEIAVFASNRISVSNDAALILPINSLGKEYVVASARGTNYSRKSEFAIVGVEDGETEIEIYTQVPAEGGAGLITPAHPENGGIPTIIRLKKGEVFQVQADVDLSGTIILGKENSVTGDDCQKFAVFGGNIFSLSCGPEQTINSKNKDAYASGGADHHFEQMKPVQSWGKDYVLVPFQQRTRDIVKVYAWQDSTVIFLDDNIEPLHEIKGGEDLGVAILNQGDYIPFYVNASEGGSSGKRKGTFIRANNPIQVAHHCVSKYCSGANPVASGDPYFIMENPVDQFLTKTRFAIFEGYSDMAYYLNVSFPLQDWGSVRYRAVGSSSWTYFPAANCYTVITPPGYDKYAFCYQNGLPPGAYEMESPTGQVGYISGYAGNFESFGYETGARMDPIYFNIGFIDPATNENISDTVRGDFHPDNSACPGKEMMFTIEDDQERYVYFTWDFGDGTTYTPTTNLGLHVEETDGDTVYHTYKDEGKYTIQISAAQDLSKCQAAVDVPPFDVALQSDKWSGPSPEGPLVVCPNATNRTYTIGEIPAEYETVFWEVLGAEQAWISEDSTTIGVDFGDVGYEGTEFVYIRIRGKDAGDYYTTDPDGQDPTDKMCWTYHDSIKVEIKRFAPEISVLGDGIICRTEISDEVFYESKFKDGGLDSVRFEWDVFLEDGTTLATEGLGGHYVLNRYVDLNQGDPGNIAGITMFNQRMGISWQPESWGKKFFIQTRPYFNPASGDCIDGDPSRQQEVFVYPDLTTAISLDFVSYPMAGQRDSHVNVRYEADALNFAGEERVDQPEVYIDRRLIDQFTGVALPGTEGEWARISPNTPFGAVEDAAIKPLSERYEYRIDYTDNCPDKPEQYYSEDFRTVFLEGFRAEDGGIENLKDGNFANLRWSLLGSWNGGTKEMEQELWRKVDNGDWEIIRTSTDLDAIYSLIPEVGEDGVFQSFKIKVILLEDGSVQKSVWSNEIKLDYIKVIYGTPIITPNGDGRNESLVIVNMNAHPVVGPKKIVIFNRWNQHVWDSEDYQQDWNGVNTKGERVPEGTYFYVVTDVSGGEVFKGAVTILWD